MGLLTGKRCLVVGGTSGIGLAVARRFLDDGAAVVVAGLFAANEATRAPIPNAAAVVHADATIAADVDALFEQVVLRHGGIEVLVHTAGGSGRRAGDGPLHECSDAGWRWSLDANLTSVFHTNRAAVRHWLAARRPGVILNTSSVLAYSAAPRHFDTIAYAAAKAGIVALSRQAAARYAADGIRVNVLAPGLVDTPMAARAVGDPTIAEYLRGKQPLARGPTTAEDCAAAAAFLCSDAARHVTGVILPVDGGWGVCDGPPPPAGDGHIMTSL
jgi:NAD(P)-dependent dehydrogenase (short-subunit alcohol dehydrogenase family)